MSVCDDLIGFGDQNLSIVVIEDHVEMLEEISPKDPRVLFDDLVQVSKVSLIIMNPDNDFVSNA